MVVISSDLRSVGVEADLIARCGTLYSRKTVEAPACISGAKVVGLLVDLVGHCARFHGCREHRISGDGEEKRAISPALRALGAGALFSIFVAFVEDTNHLAMTVKGVAIERFLNCSLRRLFIRIEMGRTIGSAKYLRATSLSDWPVEHLEDSIPVPARGQPSCRTFENVPKTAIHCPPKRICLLNSQHSPTLPLQELHHRPPHPPLLHLPRVPIHRPSSLLSPPRYLLPQQHHPLRRCILRQLPPRLLQQPLFQRLELAGAARICGDFDDSNGHLAVRGARDADGDDIGDGGVGEEAHFDDGGGGHDGGAGDDVFVAAEEGDVHVVSGEGRWRGREGRRSRGHDGAVAGEVPLCCFAGGVGFGEEARGVSLKGVRQVVTDYGGAGDLELARVGEGDNGVLVWKISGGRRIGIRVADPDAVAWGDTACDGNSIVEDRRFVDRPAEGTAAFGHAEAVFAGDAGAKEGGSEIKL